MQKRLPQSQNTHNWIKQNIQSPLSIEFVLAWKLSHHGESFPPHPHCHARAGDLSGKGKIWKIYCPLVPADSTIRDDTLCCRRLPPHSFFLWGARHLSEFNLPHGWQASKAFPRGWNQGVGVILVSFNDCYYSFIWGTHSPSDTSVQQIGAFGFVTVTGFLPPKVTMGGNLFAFFMEKFFFFCWWFSRQLWLASASISVLVNAVKIIALEG